MKSTIIASGQLKITDTTQPLTKWEARFNAAYEREFKSLTPENQARVLAQPDCRLARNLVTWSDEATLEEEPETKQKLKTMQIEIRNRWNWNLIFEGEFGSLKLAVEHCVKDSLNLSDSNLSGANLRGSDLRDSNLSHIKHDFWAVLLTAINEVAGLRLALVEGRVEGSQYEGECAGLVGTIAHVAQCGYRELPKLNPDQNRPAEKWFLGIKKGDKPETSQISALTVGWLDEFTALLATPKPQEPQEPHKA